MSLRASRFLEQFVCLGDRCEDTCCKGWGMQLTAETVDLYSAKAPELLDAVTSGEAEFIMKRDPATDYCVKFDKGWCGIHREYGTDFLGDACHFFPRVTRRLGDDALMTASLSCPEVVRLAVMKGQGFDLLPQVESRLPHSLKDYLPAGLEAEKALQVHQAFIEMAGDDSLTPERIVMRIRSVAASLQAVDVASWGVASGFYMAHADSRLPSPESQAADPFNLLNALQGLVGASRKTVRPRLDETIADMAVALGCTLDWERLSIHLSEGSALASDELSLRWSLEWAEHFQPILRRWIQTQLAMALFPFAGFGATLTDRVTILGVRFATVKLALMSACRLRNSVLSDDDTVRVIQSLSRFLDHLADPELSMKIYTETGWTREPRLRALVGDY